MQLDNPAELASSELIRLNVNGHMQQSLDANHMFVALLIIVCRYNVLTNQCDWEASVDCSLNSDPRMLNQHVGPTPRPQLTSLQQQQQQNSFQPQNSFGQQLFSQQQQGFEQQQQFDLQQQQQQQFEFEGQGSTILKVLPSLT